MKNNFLIKTLVLEKMNDYSITPMQMSAELNITYSSWNSKLNGRRCIKANELLYLAQRLNTEPSELLQEVE